ncbi:hypothetical protein [Streptomyces diastatochromogenes]|uniref:Uncharacterized protein n=1 Tax=Streptomyces diastatochromogenes TaxID=42236 RepID=A0A233SIG7_STRDA|nr:hypothetical protein [Streptomyces diastatochromogenes]OXY95425.1 hypothetical protein BEK98_14785 [Streptomyces diastatochromogenes]
MRGGGGLPYEECRRQRKHAAPRDRTRDWPAYALPPFHHGLTGSTADAPEVGRAPAPRARRPRLVDGAAVSGVLVALCVTALLVATVAVAGR